MSHGVLAYATLPEQPWRNGAGATRPVLTDPAGWALSIATLTGQAPFSSFPGLHRFVAPATGSVLVTVDGRAVTVDVGDVLEFVGDAEVSARSERGAVRVVNLMVPLPDRAHYGLVVGRADDDLPSERDLLARVVLDPGDSGLAALDTTIGAAAIALASSTSLTVTAWTTAIRRQAEVSPRRSPGT